MMKRYELKDGVISEREAGNIVLYYDLKDNEKEAIAREWDIDLHTIDSALDPEEVARLEIDKDEITIIWKIPTSLKGGDLSSLQILSVGFVLRKETLIIISSEVSDHINIKRKSTIIRSLGDVVLCILNNTIRHFMEHLKVIKLIGREIEKKINTSMENEHLLQMLTLSEVLIFYLEAINANEIVLNKLLSYLKSKNTENDTLEFLSDIIIENEQARKQAEIYSRIFAGLMDARGTIVNNNMNVLIKNLTIINVIFLPLNLIASIGGMSEFSMMTQGIPWPISYGLFCIAMVIIGWVTMLFLNRIGRSNRKGNKFFSSRDK